MSCRKGHVKGEIVTGHENSYSLLRLVMTRYEWLYNMQGFRFKYRLKRVACFLGDDSVYDYGME